MAKKNEEQDRENPELERLLEQAWAFLEEDNLEAAEGAVHKALRLEPDSPDAYNLLGIIARAKGDPEGSLEHFAKATEADPEYVEPLLNAAELQLELDEPEEALRLCEQALDVAEEEDEYLEAMLLKAEAQLASGDDKAARETVGELPPTTYPDPSYHLHAGNLWIELGDYDAAEAQLGRALAVDPELVDAIHALGLVHEGRGEEEKMVEAFARVREADLKDKLPWAMEMKDFERLTEKAMKQLPEKARKLIANVPVMVEEYPTLDLVREGFDPRMLGFFSGVPYPEKSTLSGSAHLDSIFLYKRNIERVCQTEEDLEQEILVTVLHETGHFFGLSEEELEEMGLG